MNEARALEVNTKQIIAWVTIGVVVVWLIVLIIAISLSMADGSGIEWGIVLKFLIFGIIALSWAVRTLKRERRKEIESKEMLNRQ